MPRGMVWAIYVTDGGLELARRVDADQALDVPRGWVTAGVSGLPTLPVGAKPRRVHGISPTTGRRGTAVIATLAAELWTGAVTTFEVEANDNTFDEMTVVRRVAERFPVVL